MADSGKVSRLRIPSGIFASYRADQKPTPENMTMMQAFEWYVPDDQKHWRRLQDQIPQLKATGIDNIWIPPGCKASSPGNGYDIYDLYDLGEFEQKGSRGAKWGTKEELVALVKNPSEVGVGIYWDGVLNHKAAADHRERCEAQEVDPEDRDRTITDPYEIDAWLGFDFPGRGDKYCSQKYHWYHFSGTDYNAGNNKTAIYKILGDKAKGWADSADVDGEKGNYDYLMFADLDYSHPEVEKEDFLRKFIVQMDEMHGEGWFFVGEFWKDSLDDVGQYLERMGKKFSLFDAPLVYNFSQLSKTENADMTKVFDDTLVKVAPVNAVTLVMNHYTQPYQALEAPIEPFFKPLAYALILLRFDGYPCIFYGDLYGIKGKHTFPPSCGGVVPSLILARKLYAYGVQQDYFDYPTCIGWVRYGTWDRRWGCVVIMSNAGPGEKRMHVGEMHAGEVWTDVLGWESGEVVIGQDGFGSFVCPGTSVSVWVNKDAEGRDKFGRFDADIYKN